jgi:UDP-N-acetylglucosamine 2-epimerase (non-hydrolysing)
MKLGFILGTRPEIIKLYSLLREVENRDLDYFVIHTNQHYDEKMDKIFFDELGLKKSRYNLGIGSGSHAEQTAKMMIGIEEVLLRESPDIVFVQGDTNTVLAGALVASKIGIKIGHVEAGLRSYDRTMPEEINRIVADHVSDFLFCPTDKQKDILIGEGIGTEKIFVTGNTVVDAVYFGLEQATRYSTILKDLKLKEGRFFLLTCHRPSNTDDEHNFESIIKAVDTLAKKEGVRCVFPIHPRLNSKKEYVRKFSSMIISDPLGYTDLLMLQKGAKMIFTDSGGIQEESCIMEKTCVILRTNTERPETVEIGGASILKEITEDEIATAYQNLVDKRIRWTNPFGDGLAYKRILDVITYGGR